MLISYMIIMNLLIVDDEKLTREGIKSALDWGKYNIKNIYLAEDGVKGFELVKKYKPEIILTDVRMPKMDGIVLAEKVQAKFPDTCIIFLSGYSDKEYLKAAIKLRAINYLEKPIIIEDLKVAIKEAKNNVEFIRNSKNTRLLHHAETKHKLALLLIQNNKNNKKNIKTCIDELEIEINDNTYFITVLLRLHTAFQELEFTAIQTLMNKYNEYLGMRHLNIIYAIKNDHTVVFHIFSNKIIIKEEIIRSLEFLSKVTSSLSKFFLAVGEVVKGQSRVYDSYYKSTIVMQRSFFNDYNVVLYKEVSEVNSPLINDYSGILKKCIDEFNRKETYEVADKIYKEFKNSKALLPNQVKDKYYLYFNILDNFIDKATESTISTWDLILDCKTLNELDELLHRSIDQFFDKNQDKESENELIAIMKNYIHQNYSNDSLSVKDVSENALLSISYACTFFKNETGTTINQFITNLRMEMAKKLLADSRNKITNISVKVGYTDGNYFGKVFKKATGLSPSEYREKVVK